MILNPFPSIKTYSMHATSVWAPPALCPAKASSAFRLTRASLVCCRTRQAGLVSTIPRAVLRQGFSLLEVLVACGILVVGLAGIAAILPAAGSRLSEATLCDRASAAVGVAMSDVVVRNVASSKLFFTNPVAPAVPVAIGSNIAVVLGEVLPQITTLPSPPTGLQQGNSLFLSGLFDTGTGDMRRGFFLEDEVQYESPPRDIPTRLPASQGVKPFNRGVCWGAMVSPHPWGTSPASMTKARIAIAVFKKSGAIKQIPLTKTDSSIYKMTAADESTRKTFLKGCSWVLSLPAAGTTTAPQWLEINSSWQSGANVFIIFRESTVNSPTLSVVGFDGLLSVTEQIIAIQ